MQKRGKENQTERQCRNRKQELYTKRDTVGKHSEHSVFIKEHDEFWRGVRYRRICTWDQVHRRRVSGGFRQLDVQQNPWVFVNLRS